MARNLQRCVKSNSFRFHHAYKSYISVVDFGKIDFDASNRKAMTCNAMGNPMLQADPISDNHHTLAEPEVTGE